MGCGIDADRHARERKEGFNAEKGMRWREWGGMGVIGRHHVELDAPVDELPERTVRERGDRGEKEERREREVREKRERRRYHVELDTPVEELLVERPVLLAELLIRVLNQ
jgi:hypothetical protein